MSLVYPPLKLNYHVRVPGEGPSVRSASRLLLVVMVMTMLCQIFWPENLHFMGAAALGQWVFILLPALWYWRRHRVNWRSFARIKPLRFKYIPTIILLAVSTLFALSLGESILLAGLVELGFSPIEYLLPPQSTAELALYFAAIAVSAGICEEVLIRGAIMPSLERYGILPALLFSAFFFALLHVSFLRFSSTFVAGIIIGLVVIKTGSLFAGIFYHILHNGLVVFFMYLGGTAEFDEMAMAEQAAPDAGFWIIAALSVGGMVAGLLILQRQSIVRPLFRHRNGLFPRGWFNWAVVAVALLFLLHAILELIIGFGVLDFPEEAARALPVLMLK